ncbi:MAG: radical SAM protein, partial [Candidatus Omnitrophica bacterium]|nr:radical SAM protein [Candidatus Omnitrophota bacterium]
RGLDLSMATIEEAVGLLNKNNIGLAGMSVISSNSGQVIKLIEYFKSRCPIPIVVGGPHATITRDAFMKLAPSDFLVEGEGESTILELAEAIEAGKDVAGIRGLVWRKGREIVTNENRQEVENLDSLPFPDRKAFPLLDYKGMVTRERNYTQIITSRGCPHSCLYCPESSLWKCWRRRSPRNVVDEMELIFKEYNIREFHIEDANFFGRDPGRIRAICKEILDRNLKISWQCTNGIPLLELQDNIDMLDIMAEAGCYSISLGVESFDEKIRNSMKRRGDLKAIPEIVKQCKKNRIEINCYLIIGFPQQTLSQVKRDILISHGFNFDFTHFSIFQNIAGSKIEYLRKTDNLKNGDTGINRFFIKIIQRLAYISLCLNPAVIIFIFRRLSHTKRPGIIFNKACSYIFGDHLAN